MTITIRPETTDDYPAIKEVNDLAFGQPNEGRLIENLRANPDFRQALSLVADLNGKIIGHILFFPITVNQDAKSFQSLALAPMAVTPDYQNQGIGGQLIRKGLETAKERGFTSVIVVGHPHYYPRFGFVPAARWQIKAPLDVPEEVFMALELVPDKLKNVSGTVQYPPEFEEAG
jgi:putative acetyltransferase